MAEFGDAVGARLRAIRMQQGLSLHAVETRSNGKWKAVVVGSYERGDRALTVQRLSELADFYGVPITELLPAEVSPPGTAAPAPRLVMDLEKLQTLPQGDVDPLNRYVAQIQSMRGDYNGRVLTIRSEDLRALSLMYDCNEDELADRLMDWGVLRAER